MKLGNDQYKEFIEQHILRPYQSLILPVKEGTGLGQQDKPVNFTYELYSQIPGFMRENPEWYKLVISRLSRIYKSIDVSFFPEDEVGWGLRYALNHHKVKVTYFGMENKDGLV